MPLDANVATVTKNWISRIGGDSFEYTKCDKRTWTEGTVSEHVLGSKYFYIMGVLGELFTAAKTEQVFGAETKINVGALIEIFTVSRAKLVIGAAGILNRGPKYILFPGGPHGWITPESTETDARRSEIISSLIARFGGVQVAVNHRTEDVNEVRNRITSETETIAKLNADWSTWNGHLKEADIKGQDAERTVSGTELLDVSSLTAIAKPSANIIEGPTLSFDGGGGKIDIGGQVDVNGKMFVQ
jgi:hypothetical protein